MAGAQISTSVTILNSLHGFQAISLTEYTTSAAAAIAAGSVVEIAGAFFTFVADEAINASSWTSIVTGTTAYITLTPSGTAGTQIVTATYTSTAPTWRDDLQGWYASAGSSSRVIGSVYKAEATSYYPKYIYGTMQDEKQHFISVNNATVASALSVGGNADITGDVIATGKISGGGYKVTDSITNISITNASVYSYISSYVPNVGDALLCSGAVCYDYGGIGSTYIISQFERTSTTQISFKGRISNTGTSSGFLVSAADGTLCRYAIAW